MGDYLNGNAAKLLGWLTATLTAAAAIALFGAGGIRPFLPGEVAGRASRGRSSGQEEFESLSGSLRCARPGLRPAVFAGRCYA
jgi:hypothetical protein